MTNDHFIGDFTRHAPVEYVELMRVPAFVATCVALLIRCSPAALISSLSGPRWKIFRSNCNNFIIPSQTNPSVVTMTRFCLKHWPSSMKALWIVLTTLTKAAVIFITSCRQYTKQSCAAMRFPSKI